MTRNILSAVYISLVVADNNNTNVFAVELISLK